MKIIGIVQNNHITGVEYGVIEIPDNEIVDFKGAQPQKKHKKVDSKKINNNKKHNSAKNAHIKTDCVEKGTKIAPKKQKRRYHIHATIVYSYKFNPSPKQPNLTKKRFEKTRDLFKKKQRNKKYIISPSFVSAEQFAEMLENHIISQWLNQKNR